MQKSQRPEWHTKFHGRKAELAILCKAWRRVTGASPKPQFVVMLADSGYGKTRLLHEFFYQISLEENGSSSDGYWPDTLCDDFEAMRVNPDLCNADRPIPWLWWGLRWTQRLGGQAVTRNESVSDGLRGSLPYLSAHAMPLLEQRFLREAAWGLAAATADLAASFIPMANAAKYLSEMANHTRTAIEASESGRHLLHRLKELFTGKHRDETAYTTWQPALRLEKQQELSEMALDYASAFLNPKVTQAPTIPFILVLDDAQEADSSSLDFIEKLYRAATAGDWPLLVIATHWERNWKLQEDQPLQMPPANEPPDTFFQLIERLFQRQTQEWRASVAQGLDFDSPSFHPVLIGKLDECADILGLAYPGLGTDARKHILGLAEGNPKILTDILHLVRSRLEPNDWCWQNGSTTKDLSPNGLAELRKLPVKHEEILTLLIDDVRTSEPAIIETLSISSHQGVQFLHDLTAAVAHELGHPPAVEIPPCIQRADQPHNLVATLPQACVPASEFRETRVCEMLLSQYPKASPRQVKDALRAVLLRWLHDGQIAAHPEAGRLYSRLLVLLDDADTQSDLAPPRLRALAEYFVWLEERWEFRAAIVQLTRLETLVNASANWPSLKTLPLELQAKVIIRGFIAHRMYAVGNRWCEELFKQRRNDSLDVDDILRLRTTLLISTQLATLAKASQPSETILAGFRTDVRLWEIMREDGHRNLCAESMSLMLLGNAESENGYSDEAIAHLEEALTLSQRARHEFGDSRAALLAESEALEGIGSTKMKCGDISGAKAAFEASLNVIHEERKKFGDTPESLQREVHRRLQIACMDIELVGWPKAFVQVESALGVFALALELYDPTPGMSDYHSSFQRLLSLSEEAGETETAKPLREWLERIKLVGESLPDNST